MYMGADHYVMTCIKEPRYGNIKIGCYRPAQVKMIWNVSDWLFYAGEVLIKMTRSAGSTV